MPIIGQQALVTFEKMEMLGTVVRYTDKTIVVQLPHGHGTPEFDKANVKLVPINAVAVK